MIQSSTLKEEIRDNDKPIHCCYIMKPTQLPITCSPNMPLTFRNVTITRLRVNQKFGISLSF
jgi:hypothetical protein